MPHKCVWLQDESHGILQPTLLSLAISALKLSLLFLRYIYPPTRSLPCKRGGAWEILNHVRKCRCGERIWTVIIRHLYMDESKKLFHVLAGERWGETYWKRICQMIKRWNSDIGRDIQTHTHTHTYIQLHTHIPWWLSSKESTSNARVAGGAGLIPESERSPGGGHSNPLRYSCLENPMDRGAWWLQSMGSKRHNWMDLAPTHRESGKSENLTNETCVPIWKGWVSNWGWAYDFKQPAEGGFGQVCDSFEMFNRTSYLSYL